LAQFLPAHATMKHRLLWLFAAIAIFVSSATAADLRICSFNIQFLGNSTKRDDAGLAMQLRDYDIVVIQELVSPPFTGVFPGGKKLNPDEQSAKFFNAMTLLGFKFVLSEEDTGKGVQNQRNGSATEWYVTFYRESAVTPVVGEPELPTEFLAADRSKNPDYDRVPYAFAFRTADAKLDFVLISVHLRPSAGTANAARRKHELASIAQWVDLHDAKEKDFIILGDMNIEDADELEDATPEGFLSLNDEAVATNTIMAKDPLKGRPYDHVMYRPAFSANEINLTFDFRVVNLVDAMESRWKQVSESTYPGKPNYDHDKFRAAYSDHHPVEFRMTIPSADDD
jgi:endonuclease/exonuclease/phosphatase family metal-dependent hydrolase